MIKDESKPTTESNYNATSPRALNNNSNLAQATNNLSLGNSSTCFLCNEQLPNEHKHNRCDKCLNMKCLLCFKVLPSNYQHRRCVECDLPKRPIRRCDNGTQRNKKRHK